MARAGFAVELQDFGTASPGNIRLTACQVQTPEQTEIMGSLTEADLKELAGARSFERALRYLDAASGVEVGDGWVTASVHGTERYEVELPLDGPGGPAGTPSPGYAG